MANTSYTPSARIRHLFDTYSEGGYETAHITSKRGFHFYTTELEDIGPVYLMDDFGNARMVDMEMLQQVFTIYPPLRVLT